MKVLIIEQEKTFRQSLSNFMEHHHDFEVFTAHSRKEGLSLFQTIPFDMVICGSHLPDGDGLEILRDWMKCHPRLISILMTTYTDEALRKEAGKAGIRGYLEKPFDLKQLEEAMGIERSSEFGVQSSEFQTPNNITFNKRGGEK
jgi:DNA-binding response OmpR family regulator